MQTPKKLTTEFSQLKNKAKKRINIRNYRENNCKAAQFLVY